MAKSKKPARCPQCGQFARKQDIEDFGVCAFCDDGADLGSIALEEGWALTEDERDAFGISEDEYAARMFSS